MVTIHIPGHTFPEIDLVIFDKDGTLMELHHYWTGMCVLRADHIGERLGLTGEQKERLLLAMGVDIGRRRLLTEGPVGIKKREVVMQAAVDYLASIGHPGTGPLCTEVFEEVDRLSADMLDRLVIPIPGAAGLMNRLVATGCRTAIATTDRSYRAKLAMDVLGFGRQIDLIVGADMVREAKPDPAMVHLILEKLSVSRSRALLVGDATTDMKMGSAAGLAGSVGVLTGQTSRDDLARLSPYIIESVADITVE
jgi:phosphoglycolate phosphatase-like HAD superfamily hydrolase